MNSELNGFLGCKRTAVVLDVHPATLARMEARGELIPAGRLSGRRVYREADVLKVAQERAARLKRHDARLQEVR